MSTIFNSPAETVTHTDGQYLVERHFLGQDDLPAELRGVELGRLDSLLRLLVFSDGSITRALAAHRLEPVAIELIDQAPLPTAPPLAAQLAIEPGRASICRRVTMGFESSPPGIVPSGFAESNLVADRLPPGFLRALGASRAGIGDALTDTCLEARRELLWFGLGAAPSWVPAWQGESLVRAYRIVVGGAPAILIQEGFRISREGRCYALGQPGP
jgi:chorismate-pyruvate lyase